MIARQFVGKPLLETLALMAKATELTGATPGWVAINHAIKATVRTIKMARTRFIQFPVDLQYL